MFKSKLSLNPFLQNLKLDAELCWLAWKLNPSSPEERAYVFKVLLKVSHLNSARSGETCA